jgi:prepilin-type N-terminal cleavage/methylation domain-containing protein
MQRRLRATGFTLVEVMLVVGLLGIVAASALPRFSDLRREARIASLQAFAARLEITANRVRAQYAKIITFKMHYKHLYPFKLKPYIEFLTSNSG